MGAYTVQNATNDYLRHHGTCVSCMHVKRTITVATAPETRSQAVARIADRTASISFKVT